MKDEDDESRIANQVSQLDFSGLGRQQKSVVSTEARKEMDAKYKEDIETRLEILARVAPNLKAVEQYEDAKVRGATPDECIYLWLPSGYKLGRNTHRQLQL